MPQNIYDDPEFFAGYSQLRRSREGLTDAPEPWGGPGFDPRTGQSHHYAFHVSEAEFEAIFGRVQAKGLPYGSGPFNHTDGQLYTRRGGRGFYFEDPIHIKLSLSSWTCGLQ
jgi:catechol 2,3-dioxygenase-like lactoylglutathione lyase family enzyme